MYKVIIKGEDLHAETLNEALAVIEHLALEARHARLADKVKERNARKGGEVAQAQAQVAEPGSKVARKRAQWRKAYAKQRDAKLAAAKAAKTAQPESRGKPANPATPAKSPLARKVQINFQSKAAIKANALEGAKLVAKALTLLAKKPRPISELAPLVGHKFTNIGLSGKIRFVAAASERRLGLPVGSTVYYDSKSSMYHVRGKYKQVIKELLAYGK